LAEGFLSCVWIIERLSPYRHRILMKIFQSAAVFDYMCIMCHEFIKTLLKRKGIESYVYTKHSEISQNVRKKENYQP